MVETFSWILLGVGIYWIAVLWLRRTGVLPSYIGTQGPILTVHTKRGRDFLEWLSRPKRFWRAWGNFGVGVALVVMVGSFAFLAAAAIATVRNPVETAVNEPRNVLVIPGVNEFLPLSVAPEIVFGLLIALVVHEGGHGLLSRVGDIEIKSMGVALFAIVPIGAFVEPDDESRRRADRGDQTRMFAAGVMNNFVVTLLAFGLLFGPVAGSIGVASGAAVGGTLPGSAAAAAGIDAGDRIVAVNEQPVADNDEFQATLAATDDRTVTVEVDDGSRTRTATIERSLIVTGVSPDTPFDELDTQARITAVNGTTVHTEGGLREALRDRPIATLETADGTTVTGPAGVAVQVGESGPAARSGVAPGAAVVTAIDGQRIVSHDDLRQFMSDTRPGQTVTLTLHRDGESRTARIALGEHPRQPDQGYIGVGVAPGISGLTVSDFGTRLYPADVYLGLLGGNGAGGSFFGRVVVALQLPLAGVTGSQTLPFNFAGFTEGVRNFFVVDGPLAALGDAVFVIANLLFWTGWINLNLGVFNAIPAFPLDGGHILRTSAEAVVSRLPVRRRRDITTVITTSVGLAMLLSLLLTLFGPQLLT